MTKKGLFNQVLQIAVVVKDLEEAMKNYWDKWGIGPWSVYTFDPKNTVKDMILHGKREDYAMRLALAEIGNVQWELIQPLDDKSIYADFLKEHGEGLHHVALGVRSYEEAMELAKERGIEVIQGGTWFGFTYTYLDTRKDLATIVELYNQPEGWEFPEPEDTYPKNS
ncbi:VOC family protein [Acetomicrobium sp.]|uniref:VOC family protein n=1 Tax=Acetomicrobium sp. TaxID=1872099 RepID=UPI001BCFE092|nr:VOC family protein [Acetomicrobium sp.]